MAGKRVGLAIASGLLTLLGTISPKSDLETIVAQDAKPVADIKEEQPDTYKKIAEYFTNSATEFYTKAKDTNKTKEAANLALIFDSENQIAKDLIQKAEKNKLKTDNKELKKAEENYSKNKEQAITDLYNNAIQKIQTDKKEALKILDEIWKIDEKSEKPFEARAEKLNWKKNDSGIYVPPVIWEAREKAKKILEETGEGEEYKTEDDLKILLDLDSFKRKGEYIIARSRISDNNAKEIHKFCEGGARYICQRLNITNYPFIPLNKEEKEEIKKESGKIVYLITEFEDAKEYKKYAEKISEDEVKNWTRARINWSLQSRTNDKGKKIHRGQIHRRFDRDYTLDNIIHQLSYDIRNSSGYTCTNPWIDIGFDYLMTSELVCTTLYTEKQDFEDKYGNKKQDTMRVENPDYLRKIIFENVLKNTDPSVDSILRKKNSAEFDKISECKAVSLMEFLMDKYNKKTIDMMTELRNGKFEFYELINKGEKILNKAYGKTPAELDSEWKEWVLENYVGYRQVKN